MPWYDIQSALKVLRPIIYVKTAVFILRLWYVKVQTPLSQGSIHLIDSSGWLISKALYCVLYVTCLWVLLRRKRQGYRWHVVSSTVLFVLETVNLALGAAFFMLPYFSEPEMTVKDTFNLETKKDAADFVYYRMTAALEFLNLLCL